MRRIPNYAFVIFLLAIGCRADQIFVAGPDAHQFSTASDGATGLPGFGISTADADSVSFAVSQKSTINQIGLSLWLNPGEQPRGLQWEITTSSSGGGSPIATGTETTTDFSLVSKTTIILPGGDPDVYWTTFAISPVVLGPGTYYLLVSNGNPGMSLGLTNSTAQGPTFQFHTDGKGGWNLLRTWNTASFEIDGHAGIEPVPEPGSLLLLGSAGCLLPAIRFYLKVR